MAPSDKLPATGVPAGSTSAPSISSIAVGTGLALTDESLAKLVVMTKARRAGSTTELKVNKSIPELMGRSNYIDWRRKLSGLLAGHLGGRYYHLLNQEPATFVEGYRFIFGEPDGDSVKLASLEDAQAERANDNVAVHGLILNSVHATVSNGLDEKSLAGTFDGIELWNSLATKFGGKDFGALRAAEARIASYALENRTVSVASQELQGLFNEVFVASGGLALDEEKKISALLKVFNVAPFQALRATIHETWQNGHPYTYDLIVSRLMGEESLLRLSSGPAEHDGATSLRTQGGTASQPSPQPSGRSHGRSGSAPARDGQRTGPRHRGPRQTECWWCAKNGHVEKDCRRRINGEPPNPNSNTGRQRAAHAQTANAAVRAALEQQMGQRISGVANSYSRIATLEQELAQAHAMLASAGAPALGSTSASSYSFTPGAQHAASSLGAPAASLAHRLGVVPGQHPTYGSPAFGSAGASGFTHPH
ncbi:hypothetical protein OC842_006704 [Tilletia horrida]|uniref:CCHC-type domain-containing protein n=1 Tax=Tilletia horrida TaxID=155126 RepID=A0AAN6JN49_9BASI|nr:hypothetical protein OC842_006704 [Tilletia horrida]